MTANTAAQWSEVERKLSTQLSAAERIRLEADAELRRIELENGNAPSAAVTQASVAAGSTSAQAADISAARDVASQQARLAGEAESGTQTVAVPANSTPGDNTDVPAFQPVSQVAAITPPNTELTARRVVLPARPQTDAQTFETELPILPDVPRAGPVAVTPVQPPRLEQQELPPLPSPEEISGQFDGIPIITVPQRQQIPSVDFDLSLAPSEIPLSSDTTSVTETQPGQPAPIDRSRDQPVPGPAPIFSSEDPAVSRQEQGRQNTNNASVLAIGSATAGGPAGGVQNARASTIAIQRQREKDWRFKISLSTSAKCLYLDPDAKKNTNHLLYPLIATNGVIFPYTPKIDVTYTANYDPVEVTHSNYKFYNYKNSSVEGISITGDFTAQDTFEANYLLAVIHFFKSVTKMFYGKDTSPIAGIPPPLCYLNGHGTYAFNNHPCVITSFSLNYPTDVDYVNARIPIGNLNNAVTYNKPTVGGPSRMQRLINLSRTGVNTGGTRVDPVFRNSVTDNSELTRVPSKLTITLSALPIVTRNDLSNNFSLKGYSSGELLLSSRKKNNGRKSFGGFW